MVQLLCKGILPGIHDGIITGAAIDSFTLGKVK
jgi:hypothetical protein